MIWDNLFIIAIALQFFQTNVFAQKSIVYHVVDKQRKELYTNDTRYPWRELMVRVWYPDEVIVSEKQQCPVLLFSHGLGGTFNGDSYAVLREKCVASGYVFITISHTYASKAVDFPDGRTAHYLFDECIQGSNIFGQEIETWEADILFVLDQCEKYNNDQCSPLYNKLDMTNVGGLGHSFGGAAALQACRSDDRIKAAVNIDGLLCGKDSTVPFFKPLLFIIGSLEGFKASDITSMPRELYQSLNWAWYMKTVLLPPINKFARDIGKDVYKVTMNGVRHAVFSDEPFAGDDIIDPLLMDGILARDIVGSYVAAFFDKYFKGKEASLLDDNITAWPEVVVERV